MQLEGEFQDLYAGFPADTCVYPPQTVFAILVLLIVVIGLIGNAFIIFIIVSLQEYKKSVANWYILQLALADTLFLLTLPFEAASELHGSWNYPGWLCQVKEAVLFVNYYASIYFLVVMSFDRYLAVTKAFASNKWVTGLRSSLASHIITAAGWCVSIMACTPLYIYSSVESCPRRCAHQFPVAHDNCTLKNLQPGANCTTLEEVGFDIPWIDYEMDTELGAKIYQAYKDGEILGLNSEVSSSAEDKNTDLLCKHPESEALNMWIYGNFFGAFCAPFIFICFFYGMIIHTIMETGAVANSDTQRSYRKRVTFIVLALVSLFAVSWLPWMVVHLAKIRGFSLPSGARGCEMLSQSVRLLAYLNSACNPYFYSFLGVKFRERLRRASSRFGFVSSATRRPSSHDNQQPRRNRQSATSNSATPRSPTGVGGAKQHPVSVTGPRVFRSGWLHKSTNNKAAANVGIDMDEGPRTERTSV